MDDNNRTDGNATGEALKHADEIKNNPGATADPDPPVYPLPPEDDGGWTFDPGYEITEITIPMFEEEVIAIIYDEGTTLDGSVRTQRSLDDQADLNT